MENKEEKLNDEKDSEVIEIKPEPEIKKESSIHDEIKDNACDTKENEDKIEENDKEKTGVDAESNEDITKNDGTEEDNKKEGEIHHEKSLEKALEEKKKGNDFYKAQNYEEALECYTEALSLLPDDADKEIKSTIHFNTGMSYYKKVFIIVFQSENQAADEKDKENDINSAINHYSVAIQLNPSYSKALYQRANAYEKKEEYGSALEDVKKLKELDFKLDDLNYIEKRLENKEKQKMEKMKDQAIGQLKSLANTVLGKFGIDINKFKLNQNGDGSCNISYQN